MIDHSIVVDSFTYDLLWRDDILLINYYHNVLLDQVVAKQGGTIYHTEKNDYYNYT